MARVVVFGLQDFASLAHFYLRHDSDHEVAAFTVHGEYLEGRTEFEGCPAVPFETVEQRFPPPDFRFFAPVSHRRMNRLRASVYAAAKQKGYGFISYISSKATTFPGAVIGENCFILEDNTIQPFATIGNNVVLWSGNHIGHHAVIQDHVLFTSHVVLSGHCLVDSYSVLGVNSTIRDGVHVAEGSFIAMGACVTKDTEPWSVYMGVPAKLRGSSCELES